MHLDDQEAEKKLSYAITEIIKQQLDNLERQIILLCIGTPLIMGDALGPYLGYALSKKPNSKLIIFGTFENPVHGENLYKVLKEIKKSFKNPFLIAVDAALGPIYRVGYIKVAKGPLYPGRGLSKNISAVGDMHIIGIVNVDTVNYWQNLNSVPPFRVIKMKEILTESFNNLILPI